MTVTPVGTSQKRLFGPDNHLFALARQGKFLPPWYLALLLTLVFVIGTSLALQALFNLLHFSSAISDLIQSPTPSIAGLGTSLSLVIGNGAIILVMATWICLVEKRPLKTVGLEKKAMLPRFLRGALIGLVAYAAIAGILFLSGVASPLLTNDGWGTFGGIVLILPGWIIQAAREEIVARGWLLPTQGARYRPWVGIILSALTFVGLHGLEIFSGNLNIITVLALLAGLAFSLFMATYALYEGSLWGVFGLHATWNWAEGNLLASQVSGNTIPGGALIKISSTGPTWMTGGTFGPEASLPTLIVLLIAIAIVVLLAKRSTSRARTI